MESSMPEHSQARYTATSALWGHLLRKTGNSQILSSTATSTSTTGKEAPSVAPVDRAGASTRILLHDTQAHLEKFTERLSQLTLDFNDAKRELLAVQRLYQDDHEQLLDKMTGLANRSQTELQKTMGSPAQSSELDKVSKEISHLAIRMEALDKKFDNLNVLNSTQLQALQTIQAQQGQLLAALPTIIPLLQAVPAHIENARNHLKDSILELRQDVASPLVITGNERGPVSNASKRLRARSFETLAPGDALPTPPDRKKRRLTAAVAVPGKAVDMADRRTSTSLENLSPIRALSTCPSVTLDSADTESLDNLLTKSSLVPTLRRTPLRDLAVPPILSVNRPPTARNGQANTVSCLTPAQSTTLSGNVDPPAAASRHDTASLDFAHAHTARPAALLQSPLAAPVGAHQLLARARQFATQSPAMNRPSAARQRPGGNEVPSDVLAERLRATPSPARMAVSSSERRESPIFSEHPRMRLHSGKTSDSKQDAVTFSPNSGGTTCIPESDGAGAPGMPQLSAGKPMRLKDRRAWLADDRQREGGKRFIPLDDEEDEEDIAVMT
ncbi:hypothetical protein BN946_scf184746.g5 [Trametes cinnabarina]|uniref:Uncharacterized protein n=1 Tax=Pycnoporus cinnabarinus TaxID=5643 RepID=A0A060SAN7_PYCCI|nr:hypothetical protein BN946_scf184746.g5 [Trametes cinnabarina]